MEYKINLKSNWEDLTIGDYQKIMGMDSDTNVMQMITILSDLEFKEVQDLPLEVLNSLSEELSFVNDVIPMVNPTEFVRTEKYKWRVMLDVKQLSASQFIDIVELTKTDKLFNDNMHYVLALIMEKYKKDFMIPKYTLQDFKSRDIMKDAKYLQEKFPVTHGITIINFFLSNLEVSHGNIEDYSEQLKQMMNLKVKEVEKE